MFFVQISDFLANSKLKLLEKNGDLNFLQNDRSISQ